MGASQVPALEAGSKQTLQPFLQASRQIGDEPVFINSSHFANPGFGNHLVPLDRLQLQLVYRPSFQMELFVSLQTQIKNISIT